jgi:hypothetical protein
MAISAYARWLYALLAVLIALQLGTIWRAARERDLALFELERQAASGKAVRAFVTLLLLVTIGAGIYTLAVVVAPAMPPDPLRSGDPAPIVTTPQLSVLPTPSPTVPTPTAPALPRIVTPTPVPDAGGEPSPAPSGES